MMESAHDVREVERWARGRVIRGIWSYLDPEGQRWNRILLSEGYEIHIPARAPWLIVEQDPVLLDAKTEAAGAEARIAGLIDRARAELHEQPGEPFNAPLRVQRLADLIADLANALEQARKAGAR